MYSFFQVNTQDKARIIGFDLLRCFAIFFVLRGHAADLLQGTRLEGFPWFRTPHGVDIFLVITGFFIGGKFLKSFDKTAVESKKKSLQNFLLNIVFRILPNYYLLLIINYWCVQNGIIPGNTEQFSLLLFFTFTQNLWYPFYGFYWESWSLATQMCFYLLFPIFSFFASLRFQIKHIVLFVSLFFIALSIFYRINHAAENMDYFYWDVWIRKVVISRLDCVFMGVLAAWTKRYFPAFWQKNAIILAGIGFAIYLYHAVFVPVEVNSFYIQVGYLTVSAIFIALWFPIIEKISIKNAIFRNVIFTISTLSYAMYLTNLLIKQIMDLHFPSLLAEHAVAKYLLFYGLTGIVSYLLYQLFEKPIYSMGKRLTK